MDNLHSVLRNIRETRSRRDHLSVFREFLGHLDRVGRRAPRAKAAMSKAAKGQTGKGGARRGR